MVQESNYFTKKIGSNKNANRLRSRALRLTSRDMTKDMVNVQKPTQSLIDKIYSQMKQRNVTWLDMMGLLNTLSRKTSTIHHIISSKRLGRWNPVAIKLRPALKKFTASMTFDEWMQQLTISELGMVLRFLVDYIPYSYDAQNPHRNTHATNNNTMILTRAEFM